MTPQQHKQHLLALADRFEGMEWSDTDLDEIEAALRDFAARLTPGVSDAMCTRFLNELLRQCGTLEGVGGCVETMPIPDDDAIRKALEAVFPLVDDGQAKEPTDAMIEAALHARVPGGAEVRDWLPMQSDAKTSDPVAYVIMNYALVAAMAAPPKDEV
jgi:hypothetical protein